MFLFLLINLISAWTPIASRYNTDNSHSPKSVFVDSKELVVWKNPKTSLYVVQDNVCPHRLAPLSEGEIIQDEGTIMCPYHGWQMNSVGNIVDIPQADDVVNSSQNIKLHRCKLRTYPVHQTGDVIWADLDEPSNVEKEKPQNPVLDICGPVHEREVPYSMDFLLENFFDPAHIPWVHSGMQGVRSDAGPIEIQQVSFEEDNFSVSFRDRVNGTPREGMIVLKNKHIYSLSHMKHDGWTNDMTILCIPVCAGRTRIMMCSDNAHTTPEERVQAHQYTNAFFNTDDYIVHKQEVSARRLGRKYYTPSQSDYGIRRLRQWIKMYNPQWEYNESQVQELTREHARDNNINHARFCADCSKT